MVQGEARRVLSEEQLRPDPARLAAGWVRRFIASGARVDEAIALYRELGFEVVADPVRTDEVGEDCEDCQLVAVLDFRTIYTRKREDS